MIESLLYISSVSHSHKQCSLERLAEFELHSGRGLTADAYCSRGTRLQRSACVVVSVSVIVRVSVSQNIGELSTDFALPSSVEGYSLSYWKTCAIDLP
jgi:hypothetical protein